MHDGSVNAGTGTMSIAENQLLAGMGGEVRDEIARLAEVIDLANGQILFVLEDESDEM